MSVRAASLQPALDVRPQPAASAASALLRKCPCAHPAVDGAAVPTDNPLDISRAQHLIDSAYTLRQRALPAVWVRRRPPSRKSFCDDQRKVELLFVDVHAGSLGTVGGHRVLSSSRLRTLSAFCVRADTRAST